MDEVTIEDRNGEMHVFLDTASDDHIVTKFIVNPSGARYETTLPHGEWAWHRAVMRAKRALAFLSLPKAPSTPCGTGECGG
jgi:hypothetical protein